MHLGDETYHQKILPVPKEVYRPKWSVVIPTYNCAAFLRQTLQSVLQQDPGEAHMEIIVVDDCSTQDDPKSVVEELAGNRVQFYQQEHNVGKSRNYEFGLAKSKGYLIHLLHGDDMVKPGFYDKMDRLFKTFAEASAGFCHCVYVDSENNKIGESKLLNESATVLDNFSQQIAIWQLIQPPCIVFKREVYESIGAYDKRLKYIEDWEFYVRASLNFEFAYEPEPLACYRIFPENSSSKSAKGGKRVEPLKRVLKIMDAYLPPELLNLIRLKRNQEVANYCLNYIPGMVDTRDIKGFLRYSKAFFRFNSKPKLWIRWFRFVCQYYKFK